MPKPDDLTVCMGCGEVLTFGPRLTLHKITAAELAALTPEEAADLEQTQTIVRAFLSQST